MFNVCIKNKNNCKTYRKITDFKIKQNGDIILYGYFEGRKFIVKKLKDVEFTSFSTRVVRKAKEV